MTDAPETTPGTLELEAVAPLVPREPAPPIHSRFLFVDVAALRAKQLRRGARVRFDLDQPAHKLERVAMEEVRRGLVHYDVPVTRDAEGRA